MGWGGGRVLVLGRGVVAGGVKWKARSVLLGGRERGWWVCLAFPATLGQILATGVGEARLAFPKPSRPRVLFVYF